MKIYDINRIEYYCNSLTRRLYQLILFKEFSCHDYNNTEFSAFIWSHILLDHLAIVIVLLLMGGNYGIR